ATLILTASSAGRLTAERTAFSAQSALRPRNCARPRIYAVASLRTLRVIASPGSGAPSSLGLDFESLSFCSPGGLRSGLGSSPPGAPICTGVAAPRLVAGAIAAMWLAYMMYVPALAARAPLG